MLERRRITVHGIVQGVGFRPHVHRLAERCGLGGFVRNSSGDALIEIEGATAAVERFLNELKSAPPPLAHIERMVVTPVAVQGVATFDIVTSAPLEQDCSRQERDVLGWISPDLALCAECLAELHDPADRRFRYPFLNCTQCGPRLTIITGAPYDRPQTTMARFPLCSACRAEYASPADRRFHAQPIACPTCGPQLRLLDPRGRETSVADPLVAFAAQIATGRLGALKGLGGYHLVCDASNEAAVRELRRRKQRDEKPLALMVASLAAAEAICHVSDAERELLTCSARPIVLLRKRTTLSRIVSAVAPGSPVWGVMLPYTPLHELLMNALPDVPLVMTSGNRSDEPIVYRDEDASERLGGIADVFLVHNRDIHVRCDDSVTRVVAGVELPLRRARGYAPQPVRLPQRCVKTVLAVGGHQKGTFALARGTQAIVSHHLGDLGHLDAYRALERDVALYERLFAAQPEVIAHDLHPDYASTRYAASRAERLSASPRSIEASSGQHARALRGVPLIAVQHHHAHMASCMAENGLPGPVIGVILDGAGYGTDGAIWGGEFLVGDYRDFRRAAHLSYVPLPGSEQAVREPWRMAMAYAADAGLMGAGMADDVRRCDFLSPDLGTQERTTVLTMLRRRINAPPTSSAGRLFDAVSALIGLRQRISYEGQAAMELEWRACDVPHPVADGLAPYAWQLQQPRAAGSPATGKLPSGERLPYQVDVRTMIREVVRDLRAGLQPCRIAWKFHATFAAIIAETCAQIRAETQLNAVVLSGGVFANALLTELTERSLLDLGFTAYRQRLVPPNDGGLSLGQLAVAAAQLEPRAANTTEQAGLACNHGSAGDTRTEVARHAVPRPPQPAG